MLDRENAIATFDSAYDVQKSEGETWNVCVCEPESVIVSVSGVNWDGL